LAKGKREEDEEKRAALAALSAPERKEAAQAKGLSPKEGPRELIVETLADRMGFELARAGGKALNIGEIARRLGADAGELERIAKVLQGLGVLEVAYPVNILANPSARLIEELHRETPEPITGNIIDAYAVQAPHITLNVAVVDEKSESRPIYHVFAPLIGPYTMRYLDNIKEGLARTVPVQSDEISDPRLSIILRERFHNAATAMVEKELPEIKGDAKACLCDELLYQMYGLGDIELLMLDDWLEEIAVNGAANPISVYHRKFGWLKTNMRIASEEDIYNYATQIGRKSGRDISLLSPIMDAHLISGDRVSATLFPISGNGDTITIRRFARNPWTVVDFIDPRMNTLSVEMAAFLWLAIQYEMNMLVVGGTASGKTSMLNTLCHLLPSSQRVITIEDTRELSLPSYLKWNWIPLTTRNPNPEGKGGVGMLELMVSSLRMRPDRVIVGEVRRRREAEVLFEAMHTGHAVYSTVHADNGPQLVRRLTNPPIDLPATELQALHLVVVQYRDRRRGMRRTHEITEVTTGAADQITLNSIYRWRPRTDEFEKVNESLRVMEELNLHTGMTMDEIRADIADKKRLLEWMLKNGWRSVDEVGSLVGLYYKSPQEVLRAAEKGMHPSKLLGGV